MDWTEWKHVTFRLLLSLPLKNRAIKKLRDRLLNLILSSCQLRRSIHATVNMNRLPSHIS